MYMKQSFWNGQIPTVPSRRRRTLCRFLSLVYTEKAEAFRRPESEYIAVFCNLDSWGLSGDMLCLACSFCILVPGKGLFLLQKLYISTIDENNAHVLAKQHGLGLEIAEFCTPWFLDNEFDNTDPIVREKMRYTDRFVLHAPFSELFPCAIDPKVREVAAERYRQVIQVAQRYGIKKIVIHGGYNPRIYYPIWYKEQSVLFWKAFADEIPEDMVFCLENVFEEEPEMLEEIIRQVNDSRIRMCLDVGHVHAYSKIPVFEWLEKCADIIEHFHLHNNDTSRDSHGQIMEGTIPMKEVLEMIEKKCADATLTLELLDAAPSVEWILKNK